MNNFDEMIDRKGTYCTQWDYVQDRFGEKDLLPFTISDTDFAVPDSVIAAIETRMKHPILGYTRWNHEDFKSSVQGWYKNRFDCEIEQDWIMYSPSVIYALSKLIQLKSEAGDGVVLQTPAYDAFYKSILGNDRKIVENPLIYQNESYTIDFEDLEQKFANPANKIFLLCSPHNPTGRVWTSDELEKMVTLCEKYEMFIISDEIHMDIVRSGLKHQNIMKLTQKNVALLSSGTKTFNFPGLVFSYLILPDKHLRNEFSVCLKYKNGLSSCSTLGLEATMSAYRTCSDWLDELNNYLDSNIIFVERFLSENLPAIKLVEAEATYLLWLDISGLGLSMEKLQDYAVQAGKVAIMDGKVYGGNGDKFLRLNIGCPKEKIEDGLKRLKYSIDLAKKEE